MSFSIHKQASYKKAASASFLLLLSVLILTVSCPVKRLLQNNFSRSITSLIKTNATPGTQRSSVNSAANSCSSTDEKVAVIHPAAEQNISVKVPVFPAIINMPAGYAIPYFLSTISSSHHIAFAKNIGSPLPLFLQHSRLLI